MRADASPNEESRGKSTPVREAALRDGRRKKKMYVFRPRFAAFVMAAAVLTACAAKPPPPPTATSAPAPANGPASALVSAAGSAGTPVLDPAQRHELEVTVAAVRAAVRPRLRYALAQGEDGKIRLAVYDGEGLGPNGRHPGKPHEYILFKVLNSRAGEHYDPEQNALIAAIPPPPERESTNQ